MEQERTSQHKRNLLLEDKLGTLNRILCFPELEAISEFTSPRYPFLLVMGCARSGTTLLTQWLSNLGAFACPTNLLSRFYAAPYLGALVQQVLTDPEYGFKDELFDLYIQSTNFDSTLGKTKGAMAPNSFWYFWRRFFHFQEVQQLSQDELASVDTKTFLAELAAVEFVFGKPLAMKGMILNWNILYLKKILPKILFIQVQRDPIDNALSLLRARSEFFGSIEEWYSFKPPEYQVLSGMDPYAQVAGQVYFTNKAVREQLDHIEDASWLAVDYQDFCAGPEMYFHMIREKLLRMDYDVELSYLGPTQFHASQHDPSENHEADLILKAYEFFSHG